MIRLINEIAEVDFLDFVKKIYNDEYSTEEEHIKAILEFEELTEHPSGSDLLFYPEAGKSGPDGIVIEVKEWRSANGKTGFKSA